MFSVGKPLKHLMDDARPGTAEKPVQFWIGAPRFSRCSDSGSTSVLYSGSRGSIPLIGSKLSPCNVAGNMLLS